MNKDSTIGIKSLSGGAAAAGGFKASGIACGVREVGRRDLGLLFSERPCETAAVFTRNTVKGAPLVVTREAVEGGGVRAVVANSGNANAATGERGEEDARSMQELAAEALGIETWQVAVASTGVIGVRLPMDRISSGIREASGGLNGEGAGFAESILTTDTRTNEALTVDSPDYPVFAEAVEDVAQTLAREIARDGEGATRLVEVDVEGAASEEAAAALAKSIVGSSLVKAAVFGEDANWGRVLTAMGYSGVAFD